MMSCLILPKTQLFRGYLSEKDGTTGTTSTLLTMLPPNMVFRRNSTLASFSLTAWLPSDLCGDESERQPHGKWDVLVGIATEPMVFHYQSPTLDLGKLPKSLIRQFSCL